MECEAELILATLMESQQAEPLSQQPQAGPAGGLLGAAPGSVVPGDTPFGARGHHCCRDFATATLFMLSCCDLAAPQGCFAAVYIIVNPPKV